MPGNIGMEPWYNDMIQGNKGRVLPISYNVNKILRIDPAFAGRFGMDKLSNRAVIRLPMPWDRNGHDYPRDWRENDDRLLAAWLQEHGVFVEARFAGSCVQTIAEEHAFHPVMDYFKSIKWDGVPRLDTWTIDYLGCPDTPYVRAVSSKWMISAIARIERPGCKADCVLVLEGRQDLGKSTVFSILGKDWFTDEIAALGTKDAAEQTIGIWIVELAELDALTRAADVAAAKAFISRATDRFRASYGHRVETHKRQCVFGATTNTSGWNRDETGGRRFWPLECKFVDLHRIGMIRDQLWAEAHHRFVKDEKWWFENGDAALLEAREEQARRHETDAWEPEVLKHVYGKSSGVTIADILTICLKIEIGDIRRDHQMRVSSILRTNGWTRRRDTGGLREWRFHPPVAEPSPEQG